MSISKNEKKSIFRNSIFDEVQESDLKVEKEKEKKLREKKKKKAQPTIKRYLRQCSKRE